jgi:hypothetical protein
LGIAVVLTLWSMGVYFKVFLASLRGEGPEAKE